MKRMPMESLRDEATVLLAHLSSWQSAAESDGFDALAVKEGSLVLGVAELGFASSRFICRFVFGRVSFSAEIPLGPDFQDAAAFGRRREIVRAALQTAQLLVCLELENADWLVGDPEATVQFVSDSVDTGYRILDGKGDVAESGTGWDSIVKRLDASLISIDNDLFIVRP